MLFIPLHKVDSGRRIVIARLDETPDRGGMVMDYESSKAAFQEWSDSMRKATGGQSLGNVREMHGLKAAGKVTKLDFLDAEKAIQFEIEIVDDETMNKVEAGVLTGISQGGKYGRKWHDGAHKRYTAGKVHELSLVDYPCNPDATFSMVDGAEVTVALAPAGDAMARYVAELLGDADGVSDFRNILIAQPADMLKALFPGDGPDGMEKRAYDAAERSALAEKGEAMPDGSFPITDRADLENAVEAHGRASDKAATQEWITGRAKALDATDVLPASWEGSTRQDDMQKGLAQVGRFAELIEGLSWLVSDATWEASAERDGSKIPARLAAWVKEGTVILSDMVTEETGEAMAALQASVAAIPIDAVIAQDMEKVTLGGNMIKAGARNSASDLAIIQAIHDHSIGLGATCPDGDASALPNMVKVAGDLAMTRDRLAEALSENELMQKRISDLEGQPAAGGPRLRVVGKGDDVGLSSPRGSTGAAELKAIQDMPDGPEKTTALIRHFMKFPG